ncbi:MAG: DUF86 domain-containing protein [Deltaproteobacteria bacterium]|nr:DUF86 domain-containing protein [Deltaproteobacteria bacterium]
MAIEALIDVSNHIIAQERLGKPEDYADVLRTMAHELNLSGEVLRRLDKTARFRNLLVHVYWKVNDAEIHAAMRSGLEDLEVFQKALAGYLGRP